MLGQKATKVGEGKVEWRMEKMEGEKRENGTEEWQLVSLMEGEITSVCVLDTLFSIFNAYSYMQGCHFQCSCLLQTVRHMDLRLKFLPKFDFGKKILASPRTQ